jgi:hypothetical protein
MVRFAQKIWLIEAKYGEVELAKNFGKILEKDLTCPNTCFKLLYETTV